MRRKDQTKRRSELLAAARAVLLEQGAVGLRAKDVAARAGLAPSSLLYYYPRTDELLMEVAREAMARYADRRSQRVLELDDPRRRLALAIDLGVPSGPDDEESRILYEIDALTGASPVFASLSSEFFDRQVALYEEILEDGAAGGSFRLAAPARTVAHGGPGGRARAAGRDRSHGTGCNRGALDPASYAAMATGSE